MSPPFARPRDSSWSAIRAASLELVGPLYCRREAAGYCFGFQAAERHTNPRGVVHGGMTMTVIDQVLGALVFFSVGRKPCATVSLTCDFISFATPGDWLEARTRMRRRGRSLVFADGEITCGDRLVMTASGIWKVLGQDLHGVGGVDRRPR